MSEIMAALGEDPAQFVRLLKDVLPSYPPRNALRMMIAEDIARLRWHQQRNQRAQEAKLLRALQRLELDRHQRSRQINKSYDALQAEVLEKGLRRAPDPRPNSGSPFLAWRGC